MISIQYATDKSVPFSKYCHVQISYNIDNLKTKRALLYLKNQFVPRSKHFHLGYKNQSVMLYVAEVAVYSEINTEHINTVWAESTIIEC
jgi:chloramphenicol O-acetyltransferase